MIRFPVLHRFDPFRSHGPDPFAPVQVDLHHHIPDRLIRIAQGKNGQRRPLQDQPGHAHTGQDHQVHKDDFQHGAGGGVPGGAERIVLRPVAHADDPEGQIDQHHAEGQTETFPTHAHYRQDRRMQRNQRDAKQSDESLA